MLWLDQVPERLRPSAEAFELELRLIAHSSTSGEWGEYTAALIDRLNALRDHFQPDDPDAWVQRGE